MARKLHKMTDFDLNIIKFCLMNGGIHSARALMAEFVPDPDEFIEGWFKYNIAEDMLPIDKRSILAYGTNYEL